MYTDIQIHTHTYTYAGTIRGGAAQALQLVATAAGPEGWKKFSKISAKAIVYSKCNS